VKNAYYGHSDEVSLRQIIRKGTHEVGFVKPGSVVDICMMLSIEKGVEAFDNNLMGCFRGLNF
jgi:hypothetical protein